MKIFLRYLSWFLNAALVSLFLLFAVKNSDPVTLRFLLGQSWQMPLVLLLFLFFCLGSLIGVLACMGRLFRGRREILSLKRELREAREDKATEATKKDALPPPPDAVV